MLVFLSWSGQKSKMVAEAMETWLAQVIQAAEPWISIDIDKGLRWGPEISDRLERSKVGIICLTKDNLNARWILFESGALSKTKDAYVCTLLLDIKPSDVEQPLAQFQHTTTDKEDIYQLLLTINRAVQQAGEKALAESVLRDIFETYWSRLENVFKEAATSQELRANPVRSESEMLQEILEILRNQERRIARIEGRETDDRISRIFSRPVQHSAKHFSAEEQDYIRRLGAMVERLVGEKEDTAEENPPDQPPTVAA
jgi:hypothetical protein